MDICCIPIKHARCYLVKIADFYLAIDAGWSGTIHEYMKGLRNYGIKPEDIRYLVVTHFHPDHAGLVEDIKKFGAHFILFEHQIPYIQIMERMIKNDQRYQPLDINTSLVLNIDTSESFFKEKNIPVLAIKTNGHSEDSISLIFHDGTAFTGDLHPQDLIMDDDDKGKQSWRDLKLKGAKVIYPAHGNAYKLEA